MAPLANIFKIATFLCVFSYLLENLFFMCVIMSSKNRKYRQKIQNKLLRLWVKGEAIAPIAPPLYPRLYEVSVVDILFRVGGFLNNAFWTFPTFASLVSLREHIILASLCRVTLSYKYVKFAW